MPHASAKATTALSTRPCRILIKLGFYTAGHHPLLPLLLAIVIVIPVVLPPQPRQRIWNLNWYFTISNVSLKTEIQFEIHIFNVF